MCTMSFGFGPQRWLDWCFKCQKWMKTKAEAKTARLSCALTVHAATESPHTLSRLTYVPRQTQTAQILSCRCICVIHMSTQSEWIQAAWIDWLAGILLFLVLVFIAFSVRFRFNRWFLVFFCVVFYAFCLIYFHCAWFTVWGVGRALFRIGRNNIFSLFIYLAVRPFDGLQTIALSWFEGKSTIENEQTFSLSTRVFWVNPVLE